MPTVEMRLASFGFNDLSIWHSVSLRFVPVKSLERRASGQWKNWALVSNPTALLQDDQFVILISSDFAVVCQETCSKYLPCPMTWHANSFGCYVVLDSPFRSGHWYELVNRYCPKINIIV